MGNRAEIAQGRELNWDETIEFKGSPAPEPTPDNGEYKVLDKEWVEIEDLVEPEDWKPVEQLVRYLDTIFDSEEFIPYVTETWYNETSNKFSPKKGAFDRTAGQLIEALNKCNGDIGSVIGDTHEQAGAWIGFNPVDGTGKKEENVTAYRYTLVECDNIPVEEQHALLTKLELPIAAMIHSGGKSVHALVRVDADTMAEYRQRVDFIYEVCGRNGLPLKRQNRGPARLTRMPGVLRDLNKQWLVGTHLGKPTWKEWEEWIIDLNDDLPDIQDLVIDDTEPELAPELIQGMLREGHKMLLAGPSKAHKSFALIQLAIAIAEGAEWLGWKILQAGRVLYVNLELDGRSCVHRFWDTYQTLGGSWTPGMIDVWNLRGEATRMDKLAPKLIRRAEEKGYKAVIIDPVYKVLTGDENSAEQMAMFCNQFDKICTKLNAATIFCHHHSKGAQGQKQSQDRASGSGVFARDPDTILDLIELCVDNEIRTDIMNRWECTAIQEHLDKNLQKGWRQLLSPEDLDQADKLFDWGSHQMAREDLAQARLRARQGGQQATGWRVEATMREFPPIPTRNMFFRYPFHTLDSEGLLDDAKADGEDPPWMKKPMSEEERKKRRLEQKEERERERMDALEVAVNANFGEPRKLEDVAESMACTVKTVRNRVAKHPNYRIHKGYVVPVESEVDPQPGDAPF